MQTGAPAMQPVPAMPSPSDARREARYLRMAWIASLAGSLAWLWSWIAIVEPQNPSQIFITTLGFLTVPGKYVVFWGLNKSSPLGPWGLAMIGLIADGLLALTLAVLLEPLGRLRGVGPWLRRAHERAADVLRDYPRLRRMAFWGVTLFVFLPLPGTGAVGGTFAGQLIGLSRTMTVVAIALGSGVALGLFAVLACALGAEAQKIIANPFVVGISAAALVLFVWLAYRRVRSSLSDRPR
jgi:uncharacterized membrane protein